MLIQAKTAIQSIRIDTVAQIKYVHDTIKVTAKEFDPLDLVNKVDIFYNNSWTRLIWFVVTIVSIGTIVIPFFVQWNQKREVKLNKEELKREIEKELNDAISSLRNDISSQIATAISSLEQDITNENINSTEILAENIERSIKKLEARTENRHKSSMAYLLAVKNNNVGKYPVGVYHFIKSLSFYEILNDKNNTKITLRNILNTLKKTQKSALDEYFFSKSKKFLTSFSLSYKYCVEIGLEDEFDEIREYYLSMS